MCFHQEYCGLDGLSMSDVVDLVEQSRDTLDDVWRQTDYEPYPETRMARLMDIIGETLSQAKTRKWKQIFADAVLKAQCASILLLRR